MDAILGAPVPFIAGFPGSSIPKDVELQAGVGVLDLDKGTFEISKGAGGEEDDERIDRDEACTAGLPGKEILLDKLGAVYSRFQGGKEPMCVRAKQQRPEVCFLESAAASPSLLQTPPSDRSFSTRPLNPPPPHPPSPHRYNPSPSQLDAAKECAGLVKAHMIRLCEAALKADALDESRNGGGVGNRVGGGGRRRKEPRVDVDSEIAGALLADLREQGGGRKVRSGDPTRRRHDADNSRERKGRVARLRCCCFFLLALVVFF
jgi:hypothetical protein